MKLLLEKSDIINHLKHWQYPKDWQFKEIIKQCVQGFEETGIINEETIQLAITTTLEKDNLYARKWIRYSVRDTMDEVISPIYFTYSDLFDPEARHPDCGFVDICEEYLQHSKIGEIKFISQQVTGDGCYLIKRIK